jgi:hypothetical protein
LLVIAEAFAVNRGSGWVALVDEHHRPAAAVRRPVDGCTPLRTTPLVAMVGEEFTDVTRRLLTRPGPDRLAPLALCDEDARLLGLIRVEEILSSLADAVGAGRAGGHDAAGHGLDVVDRASR